MGRLFNVDSVLFAVYSVLALYAAYNVATIVYNIFFHPLKTFPGPWYAAASRIPYLLKATNGTYLPWNQSMHGKYGQVVRVAPDELSFTDGRAWKDIYGFNTRDKDSFMKDLRFYPLASPDHPDYRHLVMDVNFHSHGRVRKVFSNAFSDQALKKQEPLLLRHTDRLVEAIRRNGPTKFNIVTLFNFVAFDTMGELTFGESLELLNGNQDYVNWVRDLFSDIKVGSLLRAGLYYPPLMKILQLWVPKETQEERVEGLRHANARVDARVGKPTDHADIWSLAEREDENGRPQLNLPEMHVNAHLFMQAGTETTATLLSGLVYYLLKNPAKLERLTDEIRTSFTNIDEGSLQRLPRLKYLAACIEEGLRIYPPVPFGLGRFAPQGGALICDHWVPEGTVVTAEHYATYHDPANFRHPDDFIPERWFEPAFNTDQKAASQPFSTGPRNCLGKNLAYHEIRIIMAKVLFNFDLHLENESENWPNRSTAYVLWEKPPLIVTATPVQQ